jgi:hypothetical protein
MCYSFSAVGPVRGILEDETFGNQRCEKAVAFDRPERVATSDNLRNSQECETVVSA